MKRSEVRKKNKFDDAEIFVMKETYKELVSRSNSSTEVDKRMFLNFFRLPGLYGGIFSSFLFLLERMFKLFDTRQTNTVNQDSFLKNLAILCRGTKEQRNKFLFKLHDLADEGSIPEENMYTLFRNLPSLLLVVIWRRAFGTKLPGEVEGSDLLQLDKVSKEYDDGYVRALVHNIFEKVDEDKNGKLNEREFVRFLDFLPELRNFIESFLPYEPDNLTSQEASTYAALPFGIRRFGSKIQPKTESATENTISWILQCSKCQATMGYCNQCGGKLQPDMLFVTEDGHQRQRMRCKDCNTSVKVKFCFGCGEPLDYRNVVGLLDSEATRGAVGKQGFLYRKTKFFNNINKNYFLLRGNMLYRYEDESATLPTQITLLDDCYIRSSDIPDPTAGGYYQISLITVDNTVRREYYAPTFDEKNAWVKALQSGSRVRELTSFYDMTREIGRGRYSRVFRCKNKITGKDSVVKIVEKTNLSSLEMSLINSEVKILKMVNHPRIIQLLDVFESPEDISLILEWMSSGELYSHIAGLKTMTEADCFKIMKPIFEALYYLHSIGIVHRDIKPENILCAANMYDIKLADLGLSSLIMPKEQLFTRCGTIFYIAPEVLIGDGYGMSADIWSAGCIMYLLLSGCLPYVGDSPEVVAEKIRNDPVQFPHEKWRNRTRACQSLVRHLLDKDPKTRFTAKQVLQDKWMSELESKEPSEPIITPTLDIEHYIDPSTDFSKYSFASPAIRKPGLSSGATPAAPKVNEQNSLPKLNS